MNWIPWKLNETSRNGSDGSDGNCSSGNGVSKVRTDPFTTDRLGYTVGYAYNGFRELIRQTNANSKVTTFSYCDCGSLNSVTDPLTNTTSYTYDNLGRRLRTTLADSSWSE